MESDKQINNGRLGQISKPALCTHDTGIKIGDTSCGVLTTQTDARAEQEQPGLAVEIFVGKKGDNAMEPKPGQDYNDNQGFFPAIPQDTHNRKMTHREDHSVQANQLLPSGDESVSVGDGDTVSSPGGVMMDRVRDPNVSHHHVRIFETQGDVASVPNLEATNKGIPHTSSFPTLTSQGLSWAWEKKKALNQKEDKKLFKSVDEEHSEASGITKLSKSLCSVDRKVLSRSNSLTSVEQMVPSVPDLDLCKRTLKKDFSFPTLHNEVPHHSVSSPSYKLTCTPVNSLRALNDAGDEFKYPINIMRTPLDLVTNPEFFSSSVNHSDVLVTGVKLGQLEGLPITDLDTGNAGQPAGGEHEKRIFGSERLELDKCSIIRKREGTSRMRHDSVTNEAEPQLGLIHDVSEDIEDANKKQMKEEVISSIITCGNTARPIGEAVRTSKQSENANSIRHSTCVSDTGLEDWRSATGTVESVCSERSPDVSVAHTKTVSAFEDTPRTDMSSRKLPGVRTTLPWDGHTTCQEMEVQHVHHVYQQIAPQCDHVKHKAWPRVKRFLKDLDPGSLVADVGCGNGRYCNVNPSVLKLGSDICQPFVEQAKGQGHEVMVADNIALPYRHAIFDAVISIGVIHHFASLERRVKALAELSRVLSPGGKLMIYVWAFEQIHRKPKFFYDEPECSTSRVLECLKFESQDVLIPWIKPEAKGSLRRSTFSCTSEPGRISLCSIGSSASEDNTASTTPKRRRRHDRHKSGGSAEDRRSRSMDDSVGPVSGKNINTNSNSRESSPHYKFGVFDKRDNKKRYGRGGVPRVSRASGDEDTTFDSRSYVASGHRNSESAPNAEEEAKMFAKWPSQLVSECRKLGKFLRSLSSKSDSQSTDGNNFHDYDSDRADVTVGENADDTEGRDEMPITGEMSEHRELETTGNDTCDDVSSIKSMMNPYKHDPGTGDIDYFDPCVNTNENSNKDLHGSNYSQERTTTKGTVSVTDVSSSLSFTVGSCSCDASDNNNVVCPHLATSYHNVQHAGGSSVYSSATGGSKEPRELDRTNCFHHTVSTVSASDASEGTDNRDAVRKEADATLAYLQLPTPMVVSSSADESDGASSGNASGSPFPSDLPECGSATSLDAASESRVPPSTSDSFTSTEPTSTHSGKTVTGCGFNTGFIGDTLNHEGVLDSNKYSSNSGPRINFQSNGGNHVRTLPDIKMSDNDITVHCFLRGDKSPFKSCSNTSTEVNFEASDLAESPDCLDSDSVFSVDQDTNVQRNGVTGQNTHTQTNGIDYYGELKTIPLKRMSVDLRDDKAHVSENDDDMSTGLKETPGDPFDSDDSKNYHNNHLDNSQTAKKEGSQVRSAFKTIFLKIADTFHLRPTAAYKPFDKHSDGKFSINRYQMETDSSDNDTSISNVSSYSSYYQCQSPDAKGMTSFVKYPFTSPENDSPKQPKEKDFQETDGKSAVDQGRSGPQSHKATMLDSTRNSCPNFVDDVAAINRRTPEEKNTSETAVKPYTIQVDSLNPVQERKDTFIHSISQKWSNFLHKGKTQRDQLACRHYSSLSFSSSEGEQENVTMSLLDNEKLKNMDRTSGTSFTKRPNSLDFTKKRTRSRGRRPPVHDSKVHEDGKLTLSDAMTLLGDGATEDSVMTQLDQSAKVVFAEMKRMNFAIRKFPLSSLDGDSADETSPDVRGAGDKISTKVPVKPEHVKVASYKMRNERRRYPTRRRFSDSLASHAVRSKRGRGLVQLQREISAKQKGTDDKKHHLPHQCLSDEIIASVKNLKVQSDDIGTKNQQPHQIVETITSLHSEDSCLPKPLQNISNNAQVVSEENQAGVRRCSERDEARRQITTSDICGTGREGQGGTQLDTNTHQLFGESRPCRSTGLRDSVIAQIDSIIQEAESLANESKPHSSPSTNTTACNVYNPLSTPSSYSHQTKDINSHHSKSDNSLSRYYHVFKKGELDELVTTHVPSLQIVETFYDHANWCIIAQKK